MKKIGVFVCNALPAALAIAGFCLLEHTANAQSLVPSTVVSTQNSMQQPGAKQPAAETKTFAGKIVKQGNELVLSDADSKTTYKLDDQEKAKEFVNKDVKVIGVLDDTAGMIRVTAIEPA